MSAIGRLAHGTAVTLRAQGGRTTTTTEGGRNGGDDQIGAFLIVDAHDLNEAVLKIPVSAALYPSTAAYNPDPVVQVGNTSRVPLV